MIDKIIDGILKAEGGYINDKNDLGGETNFGITVSVARANGYFGNLKELPITTARQIYVNRYWYEPKFDKLETFSPAVAACLCDIGVNMGVGFATKVLQEALNLLNRQGKDYAEIAEDGALGKGTLAALGAYLAKRSKEGENVLVKTLNILRGARYVEITKTRPQNKDFFYGWILNRVKL